MDMDIVMVNDKVRPALCKMSNYSDELCMKFVNEVLKPAGELDSGQDRDQRVLKLSSRISMSDLKVKVQNAREFLKKQN